LNYVSGITDLKENGALARWETPVCPLVTGLPREQGEFVLERISQIARAAGVLLADEHCTPNLFIFLTAQPKQLAQAMDRRKHFVTFGDAAPLDVAEFIDTTRPVRVWYNTNPVPAGFSPNTLPGPGLPPSVQIQGGGGGHQPPYVPTWEGESRVVSSMAYAFSIVYVIADQTQLRGVSLRQFADYVGMVGLAQIKPAAHVHDAQSILKLFTGTLQDAPAGLGDWDRAFLKSLYVTNQRSRLQRSLITRSMVQQLVP
jgi:hypothetical protein